MRRDRIKLLSQHLLVVLIVFSEVVIPEIIDVFLSHYTSLQKLFGEDLITGGMILDLVVHNGLSKVGLILFIVAESSISDNIDEKVLVELLSEGDGNLHALVQNVRHISVHVNNGSIDDLGDFGTVVRGPVLVGESCETDLVVEHNMDNSSSSVVHQIFELDGLINDTLTGNGSVTMDNDS